MDNFEILLAVLFPNTTTTHAITYTNALFSLIFARTNFVKLTDPYFFNGLITQIYIAFIFAVFFKSLSTKTAKINIREIKFLIN